ncbi:outer membrane protein assembly factor BamB family protein [Streptomyces sp. NPDC002758]
MRSILATRRARWSALWGAAMALAVAGTMAATPGNALEGPGVPVQSDWVSAGQNNHNTHNAATEHIINAGNVSQLKPKWTFTTTGDVSATPTVVNGTVYAPDWGGKLWAVDAKTGKEVWSRSVSDYTGIPQDASRTSPAYWNGELVIGTGLQTSPNLQGAYVVGINAHTGAKLWSTKVESHPAAIITGSVTVDNGVVYVGTSSKEEGINPPLSFRGSIVALSATTGKVLWRTYTIPQGYTGGAVWGSQPVVDHKTGMLYVGTGNNYSVPDGVCLNPNDTTCTPPSPDNHIDAILGLDLKTGALEWSRHTLTADAWTLPFPNDAPDYDFGAHPQLYTTTVNGKQTDLLGIGQKSGIYYALDPATGKIVWQTQAGPGGPFGGIEWGTATDGKHIFASIVNGGHQEYTLTAHDGTKSTTTGGLWVALDAATGKIDWQTADPQSQYVDDGFVSSANGVVYVDSAAPTGNNMYALDAETGEIKWGFPSGGSVWSGAAIVDGSVYWGSGYSRTEAFGFGYNGGNNKLYGFSLNGK